MGNINPNYMLMFEKYKHMKTAITQIDAAMFNNPNSNLQVTT